MISWHSVPQQNCQNLLPKTPSPRQLFWMKLPDVWGSVPLDAVGVGGAFVVFEVGEERRLDGDVEVVALVGADGDEAGAHGETVHVSRDVAVHVCQLVGVEVV